MSRTRTSVRSCMALQTRYMPTLARTVSYVVGADGGDDLLERCQGLAQGTTTSMCSLPRKSATSRA